MLRSIGKQSGESVESVLKKKNPATMRRICRKEGFKPEECFTEGLYVCIVKFRMHTVHVGPYISIYLYVLEKTPLRQSAGRYVPRLV